MIHILTWRHCRPLQKVTLTWALFYACCIGGDSYYVCSSSKLKSLNKGTRFWWHGERRTIERHPESDGWLPSVLRPPLLHCWLCHHKSSSVSLPPLWMECNLPSALWKGERRSWPRALPSAQANDRVWQRTGHRDFPHNPYSTHIDPTHPCLFSQSNGWHCPSLATVSTNN